MCKDQALSLLFHASMLMSSELSPLQIMETVRSMETRCTIFYGKIGEKNLTITKLQGIKEHVVKVVLFR